MGRRLIALVVSLMAAFWLSLLHARADDGANQNSFDIGIIIDNRLNSETDAAKADVDALFKMFDRQMHIEHIMLFDRPTIEVVCDIFGCPGTIEPFNPFPPLLWQITREEQTRLVVYYIGDGRVEGLERQLLFARTDDKIPGDVVAFSVEKLHERLALAGPDLVVLLLDTGFAPRPMPCASEDPRLINDALLGVRRNYLQIAQDHWNHTANLELAATTPVQPSHCDRFDEVLEGIHEPLFTKFLLKGIVEAEADREPFGDDDGLIDLGEIEDYLDDRIKRAARFQWGRLQNVRAVGPRSRRLASVDRRDLSPENTDVIVRRNRPPDPGDDEDKAAPDAGGDQQGGGGANETRPKGPAARCRDDPSADGCHPCVLDPDGKACAERCQEDQGSDLCAKHLTSSTELARSPGGTASAAFASDLRAQACRWMADEISPYASALVRRVRGDTATSCAWAEDRSSVELGPVGKIFMPIAWRLGRSSAQDAVICLLDCDRAPPPSPSAPATGDHQVEAADVVTPEDRARDIASRSAFNLFVCNELHAPLPSYIGLSRWMPGPLVISEGLRAYFGCPPTVTGRKPPLSCTPELPGITIARCPPETVFAYRQNPLLADWLHRSLDLDLTIGGLEIQGLDVKKVDVSAPRYDICVLDKPRPKPKSKPKPKPPQPEPPKFELSVSKIRWMQMALTVDNRNPGPIDGTIGDMTRAAIQSWRQDNKSAGLRGDITEKEFQEIIRVFGERFHQIHGRVPSF
ncbi:MAG: hypothetical protein OEU92_02430 [Alphaproteobacteria bacterium]|nr:hypothetical protein [Alphaproteobacteria bacterium]